MASSNFPLFDPWRIRPNIILQEALPEAMRVVAEEIRQAADQEEALHQAYDALAKKYRGYRILTFLRLDCLLLSSLDALWARSGFLHCHHLNYLLRTLLVTSGHFENQAIQAHWTQIWLFSPHQYLTVAFEDGRVVEVDPWGRVYGIPLGSHAHGLKSGSAFAQIT